MDDDFATVELGTFDKSACSPSIPPLTEALRLSAPSVIELTGGARFPLCGTYVASAPLVNRHFSVGQEIVIVATDAKTHEPWAANLTLEGALPSRQAYDESIEGWERRLAGGWFNVDLFRLLQLPREPGRYHVFATVAHLVSNVHTIELVKP